MRIEKIGGPVGLTLDKYEAVASALNILHADCTGKWSRCQWSHKVGKLDLINLKNRSVVDIEHLVDDSPSERQRYLEQLAKSFSYEAALKFIVQVEWEQHGERALAYLRTVEWRAQHAEDLSLELIVAMREGYHQKAAEMASKILNMESVRESGKPVWKDFCHLVIDTAVAIEHAWEPRLIVNGTIVLGDRMDTPRIDQKLHTPREWNNREIPGQHYAHLEWSFGAEGALLHWSLPTKEGEFSMEAV